MRIKSKTGEVLGCHNTGDIKMITLDTFKEQRMFSYKVYHNCQESDKGPCLVVVTKNFNNHIYPKDSWCEF